MLTSTQAIAQPGAAAGTVAPGLRRRLYLFSPLPPQRNGLADYIGEYLPLLAADFDLCLVAESGCAANTAAQFSPAPFEVLDEAVFLARQPEPGAQILYNVGNNGDCAYMLDHMHRFPGVVIVHDVSLFYLHQAALQMERAHGMFNHWVLDAGYQVPADFVHRDGSLSRTPGLLYQECLMLRRIAQSARGLMLHSRYAEARFRGGAVDVPLGAEHGRPMARIPHFVLPPAPPSPQTEAVLRRWRIEAGDVLLLVPGFLTGNKMLYEVLVAFLRARATHPRLRLLFAGEERASEYAVSDRIRQLWPEDDGPLVTGYLDAHELDILLGRADLSFVLRYPTYGETSGILPRAVMGGGRVVTVDIGSYPEFESPLIDHVSIGAGLVDQLVACIHRACADLPDALARAARRASEAQRADALTPRALYPRVRAVLDAAWGATP
jgi:glycosyltransferase involved in cell wall biosynthesis